MRILVLIISFSLLLFSCNALTGVEIARLPINKVSVETELIVEEVSLDLVKNDEIAIWSELDVKYEGETEFRFRIEILKNGESFETLEIDPTQKNITIGEIKTEIFDKTKWKFSGKNTTFHINEDSNYTFKAIFIASENPTLIVDKAELVLKK